MLAALHARGGLVTSQLGFDLTKNGVAWLANMDLHPKAATGTRRYAYPCLDWSERRDHLAGQLADELLTHFLQKGWVRRADGRALELTPLGTQVLVPML